MLHLQGLVNLLGQMVDDFCQGKIISTKQYKILESQESPCITRRARLAAFEKLNQGNFLVKVAMDTRKLDQEHQRIPRENLQNYHRSQQFLNESEQEKVNNIFKLFEVTEELQKKYGSDHNWHTSYSRVLRDTLAETLMKREGFFEVFSPRLSYLEQLLYSRYRISLAEISKFSNDDLFKIILSKDEGLLKRGLPESKNSNNLLKDGNVINEGLITSLLNSNGYKRGNDKVVERVITITIRDELKD